MKQCFLIRKTMHILKVYSMQYTLRLNYCKKISFGQNKRYKTALFFLSRPPTHHSFTFNLRFLYELKHKVRLSKTVRRIFHFRFRFDFIKVYIFVQQKFMEFLTLKRHNFFQVKIIERPHTV